ncbi:C-C chemokine receptor type 8-like [Triplophysa rosa]|uniref:C-C chemokine receptor type 8-like n=1 Tax=Triplophysa rosa TaxID=992332 RepID=UPI002545BE5D|nr:C-C chemokine receptor type 8-like [Triplophysa rosa]
MHNPSVNITTPEASTIFTNGSMTLSDILKIFLCSINVLFGVPTNSYVIWLIVTGTESSIISRFFNLNLSVCEIGNCLNSFLFILLFLSSSLTPVSNFFQGLGITGRPLFQCLISVERYLAVVHPVIFLKYKPLRYRVMFSTGAWIICLVSCFCCIFILVSFDFCFFTLFFLVQYLVFLSIQLFCLTAVLRALKQSGPGERGREREEENHMKRRAFHLILITTVSTLITYGPFTIAGIISIVPNTHMDLMTVWVSALICYLLAGFVQPVLFLQRAGKLSCLCCSA